jgi:2,5-dihydroxypyridine 5,6-dioxygenase
MLHEKIEATWIDVFADILARSEVGRGMPVALLSETRSRRLNVELAELAALRLGARPFHVVVPTPRASLPMSIRSTGASEAIGGLAPVVAVLASVPVVVDLTVEGLMHARETKAILAGGARILVISNEHPETFERLGHDPALEARVKAAAKAIRGAKRMTVTSPHGTDLTVDLEGASTVGVWGSTTKPGTLTHVPAGIVVSFPRAGAVNGALVFAPGDVNLTFKRYFEREVRCRIDQDYVTEIAGEGFDAEAMRRYLAAFGEREAYAVSHVGFGLNERARYEALAMVDKADTNGTEIRAVAGNFLFSTGANEFAGRYTAGHFDLPAFGTTIALDGKVVVRDGKVEPFDA